MSDYDSWKLDYPKYYDSEQGEYEESMNFVSDNEAMLQEFLEKVEELKQAYGIK